MFRGQEANAIVERVVECPRHEVKAIERQQKAVAEKEIFVLTLAVAEITLRALGDWIGGCDHEPTRLGVKFNRVADVGLVLEPANDTCHLLVSSLVLALVIEHVCHGYHCISRFIELKST